MDGTGSPPTGRPARLHDVARAVGLHVSTVSRVLHNPDGASVRPETRERVLAAASRLRYRPNANARGLRLATTGAIGCLTPSLLNPTNLPIVRGAFERAWARGFVVLLAEDAGGGAAQVAYDRLVEQRRIDGLLISSATLGDRFFDGFADGHIPAVFVDRGHRTGGRNVVMRDGDAGRLAATYLVGLGHRRLAHLAGPDDLDTTRRRRDGFLAAAADEGVDTALRVADLDERAGYDGLLALMAGDPRPTAVYVANINQAVGAVAAARGLDLDVPGDVSVLSHDDAPLAEFLAVPLSAIAMPLAELGAAAVDLLLDVIDGAPSRDVEVSTPPTILERGSTGPPGG